MLCWHRASVAALVSFASFQLVEYRSHLPDRGRRQAPRPQLRSRPASARPPRRRAAAGTPAAKNQSWRSFSFLTRCAARCRPSVRPAPILGHRKWTLVFPIERYWRLW